MMPYVTDGPVAIRARKRSMYKRWDHDKRRQRGEVHEKARENASIGVWDSDAKPKPLPP